LPVASEPICDGCRPSGTTLARTRTSCSLTQRASGCTPTGRAAAVTSRRPRTTHKPPVHSRAWRLSSTDRGAPDRVSGVSCRRVERGIHLFSPFFRITVAHIFLKFRSRLRPSHQLQRLFVPPVAMARVLCRGARLCGCNCWLVVYSPKKLLLSLHYSRK
jgi:hypothetical protein